MKNLIFVGTLVLSSYALADGCYVSEKKISSCNVEKVRANLKNYEGAVVLVRTDDFKSQATIYVVAKQQLKEGQKDSLMKYRTYLNKTAKGPEFHQTDERGCTQVFLQRESGDVMERTYQYSTGCHPSVDILGKQQPVTYWFKRPVS